MCGEEGERRERGDSNAHYALERGRGGREEKKKKEEGDRRERGGKNVSCVSEVFT